MNNLTASMAAILLIAGADYAAASSVTIPNTFATGTTAVAGDVNANFTALATGVNDNDTRVTALESTVATLQSQVDDLVARIETLETDLATAEQDLADAGALITQIQGNSVLDLDGYLLLDQSGTYNVARFTDVNVQIVNGTGVQSQIDGLGNLIIGYDEATIGLGFSWCSNGISPSQLFCEQAGAVWAESQKSGSHNLVVGSRNSYTGYGGAVFGENNVINADAVSVLGGSANMVRHRGGAIVGGTSNLITSYPGAAILGGSDNQANASYATLVGGEANVANGGRSSIVGGYANNTSAGGVRAVVSGGNTRSATGTDDWVAGSLLEDQ